MAKVTLLTDFICKICKKEYKNTHSLGRHLLLTHKIKSDDYSIQYLLNGEIPKCKCGCGSELKIHSYYYYDYCSGHTPATPESLEWRNDKESDKYKAYFEKVSNSLKKFYEENPITDEQRMEMSNRRKKFIEENPEIIQRIAENSRKTKQQLKETGELKGENHYLNKMSPEQKAEVIKKRFETFNNMTIEEKEIISKSISEGRKRYWKSLSPEQLQQISETRREAYKNIPDEIKIAGWEKRSISRKAEMVRLGNSDSFKPSYNESTIPYIENVLNLQYDTKFRHAESEGGEFRIYDKEFHRTYYADAYCERLNIWIEFDEPGKFRNGKLLEEHIIRQERIEKCLIDVQIIRIYFDKKTLDPNSLSVEDSPLGGRLIVR